MLAARLHVLSIGGRFRMRVGPLAESDRGLKVHGSGCPDDQARTFFYWRLRRRTREEELVKALMSAKGGKLSHDEALNQVRAALPSDMLGDDRSCYELLA